MMPFGSSSSETILVITPSEVSAGLDNNLIITFIPTCILESDTGDCFTEASAGGNIYGSRIKPEPFKSEIVAVDGKAFSYTAFFDENEAPVNYAIFGPKFTFTGELATGSVTVKKLEQLAKSLPKSS